MDEVCGRVPGLVSGHRCGAAAGDCWTGRDAGRAAFVSRHSEYPEERGRSDASCDAARTPTAAVAPRTPLDRFHLWRRSEGRLQGPAYTLVEVTHWRTPSNALHCR